MIFVYVAEPRERRGCAGSYPAGSESVVNSVVLLLACSALEGALGLGSAGTAGPTASCPGEGLLPLLLAAGDRPDGEDGGGGV